MIYLNVYFLIYRQDRSKAYIDEQKHLKAEEMKLAEWENLVGNFVPLSLY